MKRRAGPSATADTRLTHAVDRSARSVQRTAFARCGCSCSMSDELIIPEVCDCFGDADPRNQNRCDLLPWSCRTGTHTWQGTHFDCVSLWGIPISRSTQPCIPPGSLNRVPASAGVRAGTSPLPGGR